MKIGFLGIEYFGMKDENGVSIPSSAHGGFGYLTRKKCEELVKRGHEVHVFVPAASYSRNDNISKTIEINGVIVHLYKMTNYMDGSKYIRFIRQTYEAMRKIRDLDTFLKDYPVDVFQSEEPYLYSLQAYGQNQNQVVVFQDPFDNEDIGIMARANLEYSRSAESHSDQDYDNFDTRTSLASRAIRASERISHIRPTSKLLRQLNPGNIFSEADFIGKKVAKMYGLSTPPATLPNPQDFPGSMPIKSPNPTILWLGRWDAQKRPDIALEIAKNLPDYDFYFVGRANDIDRYIQVQDVLRRKYGSVQNIHIMDFVSEEEKNKLLDKSWILLNTSVREGLPISFLEAGAHGLSIVSSVDPDNYTSMFGKHVSDKDFQSAIKEAVKEEWFKTKGKSGYDFMKSLHETSKVIEKHLSIYKDILDR